MEAIGLAIGALIALFYFYVIRPITEVKREAKRAKEYADFQIELEKGKEKIRLHFKEMRDRQERFHREMEERHKHAERCINLVTPRARELDRDEWEEWILLENPACMPISMGKIINPYSNDKKENT